MLKVLSDGQWHTAHEMAACVDDELSGPSNFQMHISHLRKRLIPKSEGIATLMFNGKCYYQHTRIVAGSDS